MIIINHSFVSYKSWAVSENSNIFTKYSKSHFKIAFCKIGSTFCLQKHEK